MKNSASDQLTYHSYPISAPSNGKVGRHKWFNRSKATSPIRKQFLQFERYAETKGYCRHCNEPIEQWFHRIGLEPQKTNLYQKVRYGNESLTKSEEHFFIGN
ncbi:hypothetical protein [Halobacillus sp. BBL2006]|uniref:hypothetical protein n=1 Tax=Halobacillus sp. BBL2006 TaxID=1543706 RepID=UPI0005429607|nr:hypothetical protein [Halobacillus sp. BBL2006]KHE73094.1 hypothetical protein LD39_01125 [Halobacillus sp. BBL2006]